MSKFAFLGARSCELHAIAIQDKVFLGGSHVDAGYKILRENKIDQIPVIDENFFPLTGGKIKKVKSENRF